MDEDGESNGETLPALVATPLDNPSAIGGRHPLQETVGSFTPSIAGLVGNRHRPSPKIKGAFLPILNALVNDGWQASRFRLPNPSNNSPAGFTGRVPVASGLLQT